MFLLQKKKVLPMFLLTLKYQVAVRCVGKQYTWEMYAHLALHYNTSNSESCANKKFPWTS